MSCTTADVADAVVAELLRVQEGDPPERAFDPAFEPVRSWRPRHALAALATLKVSVVPISFAPALAARRRREVVHTCEVALQQRVSGGEDPACDRIAALAQAIALFWLGRRLEDPQIVCTAAALAPESARHYVSEHLDADNVFTAVVALTFRRWEDAS